MRPVRFLVPLLIVVSLRVFAQAAELKVKVLDPQSVAVAGAQVSLLSNSNVIAVQTTSGEGATTFSGLDNAIYTLRILAPGFAPVTEDVHTQAGTVSVGLQVATAPAETVVVTATRSPVAAEDSVASVSTLEAGQLEAMQPVNASDALRFLPGAVLNNAGQTGGLTSLFVRGGDSRYNKVIVDGVPINEPGGTFDFGVSPMSEVDRMEFVRGAQSTLYGSDAMTSVVQQFTRTGSTRVPELLFGADGGNLWTAHGFASLAGARGRFDYDLFGDQFNTSGQGPNDEYSNSLVGANVGVQFANSVLFRFRTRHDNSFTGVQGEWNFNGTPLIPPDMDQHAHQNNFLASAELMIAGPSKWQHRITGFEYNHKRLNEDNVMEPSRLSPLFGNFDFPFRTTASINRAGFDYQGDYAERTWARTTVGGEFEDENGYVGDLDNPPLTHGLRLNYALYGQQTIQWRRLSVIAGARFVHNETFGNKGVPRVAVAYQLLHGGEKLSGTRLRFSYATGIKEPRFEESFASPPFVLANPDLKAEENRAFEAGLEQSFLSSRYTLSAIYFNNLFRNQIDFQTVDFTTFAGMYVNINKSIAHGAELELKGRVTQRIQVNVGYTYLSSQVLEAPFAFDAFHAAGAPLLRRPKHSGSLLLNYLGTHWGGDLGGSFVGRRADSDFDGFGYDHAAGYARVDLGGWYAVTRRVTAYASLDNALNKHYEEVVGYPALHLNFRAGLRFRIGGE
jgi:outer membrane cobalamin receptor